jgi:ribosomal protein L30/L7E
MVYAVLRMSGAVKISWHLRETLDRLRLGKKLTLTFVEEKDDVRIGMIRDAISCLAYGTVDKKLMDEIIAKRGQKDIKGNYRGFCRMHPPIGGFKKSTKLTSPKGILGKNDEISKLLVRMI